MNCFGGPLFMWIKCVLVLSLYTTVHCSEFVPVLLPASPNKECSKALRTVGNTLLIITPYKPTLKYVTSSFKHRLWKLCCLGIITSAATDIVFDIETN